MNKKTLFLTQFSILLAIEALFCFTILGSLPISPTIVATLAMIPIIITAIMLGTKAGAAMGFAGGLFSFIVWTFMPPNPAFAFVFTPLYRAGEFTGNFWSVLICFVPRILVGVVAGGSYRLLSKTGRDWLRYGLSGVLGSLVNTVGVLGGIYLFFAEPYASLAGQAILVIIGTTVATNGVIEAAIGGISAYAVCKPLNKVLEKRNG